MANKFQLSVLERLEQERQHQKGREKPPARRGKPGPEGRGHTPEPGAPQAPRGKEPVAAPEAKGPGQAAPQELPSQELEADLTRYLRLQPERRAKNKTFYLDEEVIDALKKAAKKQRVTDSKLCNDILRGVLGL